MHVATHHERLELKSLRAERTNMSEVDTRQAISFRRVLTTLSRHERSVGNETPC